MRTTTLLRFGLVMLPALAAAGCGNPETSAGPSGEDAALWGRDFLSTSVTEDGQPRPLVAGTRIRLGFTDDRRLAAHAGCNSMGAAAGVADGRLVVEELSTTEMGCDPPRHDQDEWLARLLAARPLLQLEGSTLTLLDGATEIRLEDRRVADPDRALRGTRWVVDTVVDGDTASSVPPGADAHLVIDEGEDRFGGSTGCNQMGGSAAAGDDSIRFADVVATRMACPEERMRLEAAVLAVLDGDVGYEIEAATLRLTHPDGKGLHLRASS